MRAKLCAIEQPPPGGEFRLIIRADKRPSGEHARRFNTPSTNEVAILMVGEPHDRRDILIHQRDARLQRVSDTHRSYDALQYPVINWQGQDGYHFLIPQVDPKTRQPVANKKVTSNDFYMYMIMIRPDNVQTSTKLDKDGVSNMQHLQEISSGQTLAAG